MSHNNILTRLKLIILILITLPAIAHENSHQKLVLVTSSNNQIQSLQPSLIRKLFLNVPVTINQQQLIPLINTSDKLLYEIFLQKVAYMSARNYDRLLISKTFRTGKPRPEKHPDNTKLANALRSTPGSVSVMWEGAANKQDDIVIIQTLWQANH